MAQGIGGIKRVDLNRAFGPNGKSIRHTKILLPSLPLSYTFSLEQTRTDTGTTTTWYCNSKIVLIVKRTIPNMTLLSYLIIQVDMQKIG